MPMPTYTQLLLPLLQLAADAQPHRIGEAVAQLADYMGLSDAERAELMPSGRQLRFNYRVHVANTHLKKAGLLQSVERGAFQITDAGLHLLKTNPLSIDRALLMQYPSYAQQAARESLPHEIDAAPLEFFESEQTPKELMHILYQGLQKELADELLDAVLTSSPAFFERLVLDLLVAMGYGGAVKHAARTLGRTGDGGLDGVIREDKLGLDVLYVQAKRWARGNTVGRPVVQAFVGSLIGAGAVRGVLLTTSRFSAEAVAYAASMQNYNIVLIDGAALAELMIEHGVGVSTEAAYTIKAVNRDYFDVD